MPFQKGQIITRRAVLSKTGLVDTKYVTELLGLTVNHVPSADVASAVVLLYLTSWFYVVPDKHPDTRKTHVRLVILQNICL